MAEKKTKPGDKQSPKKPEPDTGSETDGVVFDDIMDAILGADTEAVRRVKAKPKRNKDKNR